MTRKWVIEYEDNGKGKRVYFDAVVNERQDVIFNGTPEQTVNWLRERADENLEKDHTVWTGHNMRRVLIPTYLQEAEIRELSEFISGPDSGVFARLIWLLSEQGDYGLPAKYLHPREIKPFWESLTDDEKAYYRMAVVEEDEDYYQRKIFKVAGSL